MLSLKFFVLGGIILILTGTLQLFVRPRQPHEVGLQRFVNRGTIWAAFCVTIGLFAILVGVGVIPLVRLPL